tara:strand:+ start:45 stop:170 length:126 start_codon:yes stop_codon:yes gene_type:complete
MAQKIPSFISDVNNEMLDDHEFAYQSFKKFIKVTWKMKTEC